jgi:hypothetical protein
MGTLRRRFGVAAEADLTARRRDRDRAAALFRQAAALTRFEPERRADDVAIPRAEDVQAGRRGPAWTS